MLRRALFLCASIVIAANFGCTPAPAQQPPPSPLLPPFAAAFLPAPPPVLRPCRADDPGNPNDPNDLGSFVPKVAVLLPGFNPETFTNPQTDPNGSLVPLIQADLKAAFLRAPGGFRTALCGLDGVYIDPSAGQSWGFRNWHDKKRYIGLAMMALWPGDPIQGVPYQTLLLSQYENRIFGLPLSWDSRIDGSTPAYGPARPNDGPMTILAALAHEFGHALWSDILVTQADGNGIAVTDNFCSGILTKYIENDQTIPFWSNLQSGPWKIFEDIDANPVDIPDDSDDPFPGGGDPDTREAKVQEMWNKVKAGGSQNIKRAHKILDRVLAYGRPFPSLLGAFSANEQFVETFTLNVLMKANLTSLPLTVSSHKIRDIPSERLAGHRNRLAKVLQCFDSITGPPS